MLCRSNNQTVNFTKFRPLEKKVLPDLCLCDPDYILMKCVLMYYCIEKEKFKSGHDAKLTSNINKCVILSKMLKLEKQFSEGNTHINCGSCHYMYSCFEDKFTSKIRFD